MDWKPVGDQKSLQATRDGGFRRRRGYGGQASPASRFTSQVGGGFSAFYGVLAYAPAFCDIVSMRKSNKREFSVVIERDEEGFYIASVPELHGCHTQARSLDQLMRRVREAIELCLEVEQQDSSTIEFIGVQRVAL